MSSRWMFVLSMVAALVTPMRGGAAVPSKGDPLGENAALYYWQAFGMLPKWDDKQQAIVDEALDGRRLVDREVRSLADSVALRQLQRGAKVSRCVWGLDVEAGLQAPLPHAWRARKLAELACLRACVRFEQGRAAEAIEDLAAAMTLGRHIANDGLLILIMVDYSIERTATGVAARYLPTLEPEQLAALSRHLETLPARTTTREGVMAEKEILVEWLIREVQKPGGEKLVLQLEADPDDPNKAALARLSQKELVEAAKGLLSLYDRLAELMSLPPEAVKDAEDKLLSEDNLSGPVGNLAQLFVPSAYYARHNEAVQEIRLAMLKAGIAAGQRGKAALAEKEHRDPFGDGPFQYVEVEGGYQLRAKLAEHPKVPDKPVSLTFGRAPAK